MRCASPHCRAQSLPILTAWPFGQGIPQVPLLSAPNVGTIGNDALVPAGKKGAMNVFVSNKSNVVIDIDGYFAQPAIPARCTFIL
jgi:hypothetical protein